MYIYTTSVLERQQMRTASTMSCNGMTEVLQRTLLNPKDNNLIIAKFNRLFFLAQREFL